MKSNEISIALLSAEQLVQKFEAAAREHGDAILHFENIRANRILGEMQLVEAELMRRKGDQRRRLLELFDDTNAFVRLSAAKATLAVAPSIARRALEAIAESKDYPANADARMAIRMLDRGVYRPK
ncbi:MAG: hypothetical protein QOG66_2631 [Methylobacteriaceae bacterium]|jgi:hypothetical protein|nr:hypothetical protein [Methylobacteriaceae bacterium]